MRGISTLLRFGLMGWIVGLLALVGVVMTLLLWPVALVLWIALRRSRSPRAMRLRWWKVATSRTHGKPGRPPELDWRRDRGSRE